MADLRGPIAVGLLLAAVGLLLIGWVVRRLAGPVFAHELTVLARRGQQPKLRAGLVLLLLVVLLIGYVAAFGWDAVAGRPPTIDPRSGRFAERFAVTVLAVQLLAVIILTPAVVGSAMTEERDRGTLDLLRTTSLSDTEIAVGKLLARLAVVAAVVAAGLPVLALALLFGGVDPRLLVQVYAVTAAAGFGLGAWSLYLGTVRSGLRAVLGTVYVWSGAAVMAGGCCAQTVPGLSGLSPLSLCYLLLTKDDPFAAGRPGIGLWWVSAVVFAVLYVGGGLLCVWRAVGRVREAGVRRRDDTAAVRTGGRRFYVPRLSDATDPLVWQEREFSGRTGGFGLACGTLALFLVGAGLFVGVVRSAERREWIGGAVGAVVQPLLVIAAAVLPLGVGVRLAGTVARERERQTLDALLMLPGDRRRVLRAKLAATVYWVRGWVGLVAGALAGGVLVGGIGVVGAALCTAQLLAAVGFAAGLAGWLTVRLPTAGRATVWALVGLLLVQVTPFVLSPLAELFGVGGLVRGASPAAAVWVSVGGATTAAGLALLPAAVYAAAGALWWRNAERRMDGTSTPREVVSGASHAGAVTPKG